MKAAKLTEHPSFRLMRQTDVQNVWHMQMPRWLFSDLRYADMSLDAKVTYTFLLNQHFASWRSFSLSGKSAAGAATPTRSIWPASRPSTIPTTNARRSALNRMNHAVPEPRILRFLKWKNRRICRPRTPKSLLLEPQILMFQNRRIWAQVILILVNLIQLSQMSVHP